MERDHRIFELIDQERARQIEGAELIASENFVSEQVLEAMGSVLTNKYAEGLPGKRYYGGCEVVDEVENLAIARIRELFGAEWANVQPHSGANANSAVMLATLNAGDTILGFDLSHGGHLTHGSPVNYSGKLYNPVFYGVERETGRVDMDRVRDVALKHRPKLIICGASAYSRDWDYEAFRSIADEVGTVLMADVAHPAGLIAAKLLNDPMPHCHFVTTTTHKTLRGPRGGLIMVGKNGENPWGKTTAKGTVRKIGSILDSGVFPGMQGGPLEHVIAAKAVAFGECLTPGFKEYGRRVMANASQMADELVSKGYQIISGGTDNHCMLIDMRNKGITGKEAEAALVTAGITVNKNMVPFDDKSPFVTSGIRLGTPAITTRGAGAEHISEIVNLIDQVVENHANEDVLQRVKQDVEDLMKPLPLFSWDRAGVRSS